MQGGRQRETERQKVRQRELIRGINERDKFHPNLISNVVLHDGDKMEHFVSKELKLVNLGRR